MAGSVAASGSDVGRDAPRRDPDVVVVLHYERRVDQFEGQVEGHRFAGLLHVQVAERVGRLGPMEGFQCGRRGAVLDHYDLKRHPRIIGGAKTFESSAEEMRTLVGRHYGRHAAYWIGTLGHGIYPFR